MRENVNELSTCLAEMFNFGDTGLFLFLHGVGLKLSRGISRVSNKSEMSDSDP